MEEIDKEELYSRHVAIEVGAIVQIHYHSTIDLMEKSVEKPFIDKIVTMFVLAYLARLCVNGYFSF